MLERPLIPLKLHVDGHPVESETRTADASPYVVAITTVIPGHGIELHSSYLGHPGAVTRAAHLALAPNLSTTDSVEHEHESIPVIKARRRCLYDHLQRLQQLLEHLGCSAQMDLGEDSLLAVEL